MFCINPRSLLKILVSIAAIVATTSISLHFLRMLWDSGKGLLLSHTPTPPPPFQKYNISKKIND